MHGSAASTLRFPSLHSLRGLFIGLGGELVVYNWLLLWVGTEVAETSAFAAHIYIGAVFVFCMLRYLPRCRSFIDVVYLYSTHILPLHVCMFGVGEMLDTFERRGK